MNGIIGSFPFDFSDAPILVFSQIIFNIFRSLRFTL